jgi:hypothetical protein
VRWSRRGSGFDERRIPPVFVGHFQKPHSDFGVGHLAGQTLRLVSLIQIVLQIRHLALDREPALTCHHIMAISACGSNFPHPDQNCPAVFAVKHVENCPHDRTPLLSHRPTLGSARFRSFSPFGQNGFAGSRCVSSRLKRTKQLHGIVSPGLEFIGAKIRRPALVELRRKSRFAQSRPSARTQRRDGFAGYARTRRYAPE